MGLEILSKRQKMHNIKRNLPPPQVFEQADQGLHSPHIGGINGVVVVKIGVV